MRPNSSTTPTTSWSVRRPAGAVAGQTDGTFVREHTDTPSTRILRLHLWPTEPFSVHSYIPAIRHTQNPSAAAPECSSQPYEGPTALHLRLGLLQSLTCSVRFQNSTRSPVHSQTESLRLAAHPLSKDELKHWIQVDIWPSSARSTWPSTVTSSCPVDLRCCGCAADE